MSEQQADATLEAIELLHKASREVFTEAGPGFQIVCSAKYKLEAQYHAYLTGERP